MKRLFKTFHIYIVVLSISFLESLFNNIWNIKLSLTLTSDWAKFTPSLLASAYPHQKHIADTWLHSRKGKTISDLPKFRQKRLDFISIPIKTIKPHCKLLVITKLNGTEQIAFVCSRLCSAAQPPSPICQNRLQWIDHAVLEIINMLWCYWAWNLKHRNKCKYIYCFQKMRIIRIFSSSALLPHPGMLSKQHMAAVIYCC